MFDQSDCGSLFGGSSWGFTSVVDEAIRSLPSFSRKQRIDKLTAMITLVDPVSKWEWYLCEFDPETKQFKGLVKGYAIEVGTGCMSSIDRKTQQRIFQVYDFLPRRVSEIEKELTANE